MAKQKTEKSLEQMLEEALVKEDEQPYEVPGNWEFVRLGEVVQINPPKIRPEISDDKLCSFVPMKAVSDRLGIIENIEMKPFGKVKSGYTSFKENDVLFAKITPCMENGKVAIAKNLIDGFGYGTTEFFVLRCSNIVSNKFLYYIVRSQAFRDSAKPNMTGTVGQRRVPKAYLYNYKFPFPPLPEQKRIVKKLSSMLGKLKDARELIREAKDTFEERRAATLNKAFTGKLTKKWRQENPDVEISLKEIEEHKKKPYKIPAKWKWVKLKEIGEIITGTTPSKKRKDFYGDKFPLFKPTDLNEGHYVTQAADNLSELGIRATRVLPERSVMVTCIGATIGKTGFSRIRGATNQQINSIIADEEVLPEYIYFTAISPFFQRSILNNASATTLPILNKTRFGNLLFPLSPLPEQKEIVRILEKLLDHEDEARALIDMEEQIDLLEKSILSKSFRGELGTNDPNDEPAIELLKRSLKEKMNK